jgi:hypothetical protein
LANAGIFTRRSRGSEYRYAFFSPGSTCSSMIVSECGSQSGMLTRGVDAEQDQVERPGDVRARRWRRSRRSRGSRVGVLAGDGGRVVVAARGLSCLLTARAIPPPPSRTTDDGPTTHHNNFRFRTAEQ